MLRKEIEDLMKINKQKRIDLMFNREDTIGIYCFLQGGYLMDYTGHRVDRKRDIWGYIEWDGKGNADKVSFDNKERIPLVRREEVLTWN